MRAPDSVTCHEAGGLQCGDAINWRVGLQVGGLGAGGRVPQPDRWVPRASFAQQHAQRGATSYAPIGIKEPFMSIIERYKAAKPAIQTRQADLLADRYDLSNRPRRA
jgi:hypothetical protein